MMFQILSYHFFRQLHRGYAKVASRPKATTPISFFQMRKLFKYFSRHPTFNPFHYIGWRYVGRSRNQNVDMIFADHTTQYLYLKTFTSLTNKLAHPVSYITRQHMITIFSRPNEMIFNFIFCMTPYSVFHAKKYKATASKMLPV